MPIDPDFLNPGGALASPVFRHAMARFDVEEYDIGTRVGPYRIERTIGSGGMGVVYLAERADGEYEQTVALKLVRPDVDSTIARDLLRRERQILAKLEHAGIARLIDGGRTADGALWFALEFVDGVRIDQYCSDSRLTLQERLKLFERVCAIIQFAHGRLLVHRDIKPANILVTPDGTIKLLDFGIAALLEQHGTSAEVARAATPGYASPEQLRGEPITIASDIFQLGLLLQRLVADLKPPRPIGAIVAKATNERIDERYATTADLSNDIGNLLADRPLRAYGNRPAYRAALFMRRHRWSVAAVTLAVLAFAATITHFSLRVRDQRDAAVANAERATQVSQFLVDMFKVADPDVNRGEKLSATEILERGARTIDVSLAAQPALRAELLEVIGRVYMNMGEYPRAEPLLVRAVDLQKSRADASSTARARTIALLAYVDFKQSKFDDALKLIDEADDLLLAEHGREARLQRAILLDQRGLALKHQGDLKRALASHQEALRIAQAINDAPRIAVTENHLGLLLYTMDRFAEAQAAYQVALDIDREQFGESHEMTLSVEENLALALSAQKKFGEAIDIMQRAIAIETQLLGADNAESAETLNMLGEIYSDAGRHQEAVATYLRSLAITEKTLGERSEQGAEILANLGQAYAELGQHADAVDFLRKAIAMRRAIEGADTYEIAHDESELAFSMDKSGDILAAARLGRESLSALRKSLPETHTYIIAAKGKLGEILLDAQFFDEARPLLEQARDGYQTLGEIDSRDTLAVDAALAKLDQMARLK